MTAEDALLSAFRKYRRFNLEARSQYLGEDKRDYKQVHTERIKLGNRVRGVGATLLFSELAIGRTSWPYINVIHQSQHKGVVFRMWR